MDANKIKQLERPLKLDFFGEDTITVWYRPGATSYNWHENKSAEFRTMADKLASIAERRNAKDVTSDDKERLDKELSELDVQIKQYIGAIIVELVSKWDITVDGEPLPVTLENYLEWIPTPFGEYMWEEIKKDSRPKSKTSES